MAETFWETTIPSWIAQGYPAGEPAWKEFGLDLVSCWGNSSEAFPGQDELIEETAEWRIAKDGNGAVLKRFKNNPGIPEHIAFDCISGEIWRNRFREKVRTFDPLRIDQRLLFATLKEARDNDLFCAFNGIEVFEIGKNYSGHQELCIGMLDDPDWISDMFESFITQQIESWSYIFETIGKPDGIWLYGDIGFKGRPFISPDMYGELVLPHNKRLIDFFHSRDLPVIFHSCGFVEPLMGGILETGIDMLQAMEVKAGMDVTRLQPLYGDRIGFMGNIDTRLFEAGDLEKLEEEIRRKVLCEKESCGCIFHSDHSIPPSVSLNTYRHALDCARKYGRYEKCP
jgi:uroporphyrinogen decarboxylase